MKWLLILIFVSGCALAEQPTPTSTPTEITPLAVEESSYSACYVEDFNERWAVFYPYEDHSVWVVDIQSPQALPFLLIPQIDQTGQDSILSVDGNFVAASQSQYNEESRKGKLVIYSVITKQLVWEEELNSWPNLGAFDGQGISYGVFGAEEVVWYNINPNTLEQIPSEPRNRPLPEEPTPNLMSILQTKVPWCLSWP